MGTQGTKACNFFVVTPLALRFILEGVSFLCSSVSEALFTLSFSYLSERFFFVHDKAALAGIRI